MAFSHLTPELDCMNKEVLQIALHNWVVASSKPALAKNETLG